MLDKKYLTKHGLRIIILQLRLELGYGESPWNNWLHPLLRILLAGKQGTK